MVQGEGGGGELSARQRRSSLARKSCCCGGRGRQWLSSREGATAKNAANLLMHGREAWIFFSSLTARERAVIGADSLIVVPSDTKHAITSGLRFLRCCGDRSCWKAHTLPTSERYSVRHVSALSMIASFCSAVSVVAPKSKVSSLFPVSYSSLASAPAAMTHSRCASTAFS